MTRSMVVGEGVRIKQINLSRKVAPCPTCGADSRRHQMGHRWLRDLGLSGPVVIEVAYSKHRCAKCEKMFNLPMEHLAKKGSNFTVRLQRTAIDLVVKQNMTLNAAQEEMRRKYHAVVPATTIHDWIANEPV
jgi:transposase